MAVVGAAVGPRTIRRLRRSGSVVWFRGHRALLRIASSCCEPLRTWLHAMARMQRGRDGGHPPPGRYRGDRGSGRPSSMARLSHGPGVARPTLGSPWTAAAGRLTSAASQSARMPRSGLKVVGTPSDADPMILARRPDRSPAAHGQPHEPRAVVVRQAGRHRPVTRKWRRHLAPAGPAAGPPKIMAVGGSTRAKQWNPCPPVHSIPAPRPTSASWPMSATAAPLHGESVP